MWNPTIENKNLKIQIRSAQNVGKVWNCRKNILLAPFGAIPGNFFHGPNRSKQMLKVVNFSWWANGTRLSSSTWPLSLAKHSHCRSVLAKHLPWAALAEPLGLDLPVFQEYRVASCTLQEYGCKESGNLGIDHTYFAIQRWYHHQFTPCLSWVLWYPWPHFA